MDKTPDQQSVRNVGRLDAIDVGADHRNLERDKRVGQGIEVTARTAPGIRHIYFALLTGAIAGSDLRLAIVRGPRVFQSQESIGCGGADGGQNRIHQKKIVGVSLVVADAKGDIFPYGSFALDIPRERPRTIAYV